MSKDVPACKIFLANSKVTNGGRGVFAAVAIKKNQTIESCLVVEVKGKDIPLLRQTKLRNYYFVWQKNKPRRKLATKVAICLGWGSLYNHSYEPNAVYKKNLEKGIIDFFAIKNIKKGEEITVNYNGDPTSKKTLWIKSIKPASKS